MGYSNNGTVYDGFREEYNTNIQQHHHKDQQTTSITIENLPHIILDTLLTGENCTLGEYILDSDDSRKIDLGRSLNRQVTHANVKTNGTQTTLMIYGDKQSEEWMIQFAKDIIIPAIVKETDQSIQGIQINRNSISTEDATQEKSPMEDQSESGTTTDILKQVLSEITALKKGQRQMNRTLEILTDQVFTLTEANLALEKEREKETDVQCNAPMNENDYDTDKDDDDYNDTEEEYKSNDEHMKEQDEADDESSLSNEQKKEGRRISMDCKFGKI